MTSVRAAYLCRQLLRSTRPGGPCVQAEPWVREAGRVAATHGLRLLHTDPTSGSVAVGLGGTYYQWVTVYAWGSAGTFGFSAWMAQLAAELRQLEGVAA